MKKYETKVVCPVCGTEMEIPQNTEVVTGVALGKDSNLGTVYLTPANTCKHETTNKFINQTSEKMNNKTAQERLDALKAKGIDVSSFFAVTNAEGEGQIMKMEGGHLTPVDENDPIFLSIREGGYLNNYTLFRRWVMSQMFHALTYKGYRGNSGFTAWLKTKGYEYQWKALVNELYAQMRMYCNGDDENYAKRNLWFDKAIAVEMADHYIAQLRKHVERLKTKRCKRIPYKTIGGRNIFCSDIEAKVFMPLITKRGSIASSNSVQALYYSVCSFNTLRVSLQWDTPMCPGFVDAYKGVGAYYTLRNMIMFHGCHLSVDGGLHKLDQSCSLMKLDAYANEFAYNAEGYKLLGVLKEAIKYNNIDIANKIKSWRRH